MLLSQIGGELLLSKLTSPVHQVKYLPGMYNDIYPGAMLVVDGRLANQLRDATIRAVQYSSYKRIGVMVLLDKRTLVSKEQLEEINLCLRTMWEATSVIIKPWTDRIGVDKMENGSVPTSTIPGIADKLTVATGKLAKLLRTSNRLICIHRSGKPVTNGPSVPPTPNLEIMISTKVDTYLRGQRG